MEQDGTAEAAEAAEAKRLKDESWAVYTEENAKGAGNTMNRCVAPLPRSSGRCSRSSRLRSLTAASRPDTPLRQRLMATLSCTIS